MVNNDLIILGMIFLVPSHGYQLKKNIRETVNPYFKINNNVLYPALAKMEKKGLIEGKEMPGKGINKKVYHITQKGRKHLLEIVAQPIEPDIDNFEFMVKAVFFDYISKEKRLDVIKPLYESKKQELQDTLEKKQKYGENLSPIALTVLEQGINEIKNSIEFLEKLMELN
ncbi:PadR family transcriptional regulator [Methanobacterium sp.]|uniref:PadR family transcriptional regulator n=1 Tax=Methanobacterium sp. TaxID=2164 RepID=UPI0025E7C8F2|nr:PadR family transcriptional regulator [Methanobacterium sp.]MBI5458753.1 PadR family transcriptional regulator [Methanobacterium sp.]MDY9923218.1 PadR family transcriptional regulator [Methanobacterium sp.]